VKLKESAMKLSKEQQDIVDNCTNQNMYIAAGPGSGKSTVLSYIAEEILKNKDNRILLITFTNKAAKSIMGKVTNLDRSRITGGTFHGNSFKFMRDAGIEFDICDESKKSLIIKKVFNCRKDKDKFEEICDEISAAKSIYPYNPENSKILQQYEDELIKYNMMDFDDLILEGIVFFNMVEREYNITHILVDELQDTSGSQLELLKAMQKKFNCNIIGVADDDQCQPGYTKILTSNGYKNMDKLDPENDRLPAYIGRGSYIVGLNSGYKFNISSRQYNGKLYTIECDNKKSECTNNHKWLVRWNEKAKNKNVVYLMKKDNKYRVGWCQLFNSEGAFHLGTRSRLEEADAVWILKVTDSKQEASIWETIISTNYSIPTVPFKPKEKTYYDKKSLDMIFSNIKTFDITIPWLMEDYGLVEKYPIWSKEIAYKKQGGTSIFKMQVCNLIQDIMSIPVQIHGKHAKWKEINNITYREVKDQTVYSINIKTPEEYGDNSKTYICDGGLITGNCIYGWRGARYENVEDFIKVFGCKIVYLNTNFRSDIDIVSKSKKLIEHNGSRIQKNLVSNSTKQGIVFSKRCEDYYKEIDFAVGQCKANSDKSIAILYRNRKYKTYLEYELRKQGVKYTVNDSTEIVDRSSFKVLLAMLRISTRAYDLYDLEIAKKGLKKLGTTTYNRLRDECSSNSTLTVDDIIKGVASSDKKIKNGISEINKLQNRFVELEDKPLCDFVKELNQHIIKSFEIPETIISFLLDITSAYKTSKKDVISLVNDFGLNKDTEQQDEDATVCLSTVHGMKGLESNIVILPFCQEYVPREGESIEEERRVFYVAISRAESRLYMTYTGNMPRFIKDML